MSHCTNCQNQIKVDDKFCKKCGTKNPNFAVRMDSDVIIPADGTMTWDNNISTPPNIPPPNIPPPNIPPGKSSNVSRPSSNIPLHQRSAVWYLLPIFFTIIGGLISYFAIRRDDPKKAKNCLILGIILAVLPFMIIGFFGAVPFF